MELNEALDTLKDAGATLSEGAGLEGNVIPLSEFNRYMAECRRADAFELWCWRRLLRVPWTARISNLSILTEISPKYSLKGLMLKVKL